MSNVETITERADLIADDWASNPRWKGVRRDYTAAEVVALQGSFVEQYTLATHAADKLWGLINERDYVNALGAISGGQAVHAIQPTAVDHGRVAGANMAGLDVAYSGSLAINVLHT